MQELWKQKYEAIFKTYSLGVNTNRDNWIYDFDATNLSRKSKRMIETYNSEVVTLDSEQVVTKDIDNFVTYR